jgi:hypothetical protein
MAGPKTIFRPIPENTLWAGKRRMIIGLLLNAMCLLGGYSPALSQPGPTSVSAANLGKRITVDGWAVNRKLGAQLVGAEVDVWIDGLARWPAGYTRSQKCVPCSGRVSRPLHGGQTKLFSRTTINRAIPL